MLKRSLFMGLLLVALILSGLTVPCIAQEAGGNDGVSIEISADASAGFQDCMSALQGTSNGSIVSTRGASNANIMMVPYNIIEGSWLTGINLNCANDNEKITIFYINNGVAYNKVELELEKSLTDVTFLINSKVFMGDVTFRSPTTLLISSEIGSFYISQFLMNGSSGFGFQTFLSN